MFFGDTPGIAMVIGCATQFSRSTAGGDILSIRLRDDNNVYPQFDWQIGCAGSDPGLQGTWIHLMLSVSPHSVRVYADGVEQSMFGFPRSWNEAGGASITNPAYPNPARLSETLGAISLEGSASLGSPQGDTQNFAGYTGRMAWVTIFKTAVSVADSMCLFSMPDQVEGCDQPPASTIDVQLTSPDDGVVLRGDAVTHEEFGIQFDGDGDWPTFLTDSHIDHNGKSIIRMSLKDCEKTFNELEKSMGKEEAYEYMNARIIKKGDGLENVNF